MSGVVVKGVSRTFPGVRGGAPVQALSPVDLTVGQGDFVAILGPSGCGKSTLLRIVAGLDKPTTGTVTLEGKPVTEPGAERGMVFQSYTLFPWLTVAENIQFGPRERGVPAAERRDTAERLMAQVGLSFRGACSSARRLPALLRTTRRFCCWMSRSAPSTTRRAR